MVYVEKSCKGLMKWFQLKRGEAVSLKINNTEDVNLLIVHPGDEAFVTYDWYPYNIGEPINIDPNSSWTYIKLTMEASRTEWTHGNELSGKVCFWISSNIY